MYVSLHTRFDLLYACTLLSRYSHAYTDIHWKLALRVFAYAYDTRHWGLLYRYNNQKGKSDLQFHVPKDEMQSDAAFCVKSYDRRSVGGYIAFVAGTPVSWGVHCFKQVHFSSCEAELKMLSLSINHALWLTRMLDYLQLRKLGKQPDPFTLKCDNQVAIRSIQRPHGTSRKLAHIEKYYFYNQQYLQPKENVPHNAQPGTPTFRIDHLKGTTLVADIMTKPLGGTLHQRLASLGGLQLPPSDVRAHIK